VRGALGVEVTVGRAAQHQRQHDLGEQNGLQVRLGLDRLGLDRLGEPRLDVGDSPLGDGVALAVGSRARLCLSAGHLAVAGQAGEGGVDLPERERLAPPEELVIVTLQVIAMARLSLEQAKQSQRNAHGPGIHSVYTLRR